MRIVSQTTRSEVPVLSIPAQNNPTGPEPFRCEVRPARDAVLVCPIGELDLATAPVVEAELHKVRDAGFTEIVLDLRGLTFLDSTGLRLLVSWTRESQRDGWRFAAIPAPDDVQRVVDMACLGDVVAFVAPDRFTR
jgi:anti-sigma B factor antagonist